MTADEIVWRLAQMDPLNHGVTVAHGATDDICKFCGSMMGWTDGKHSEGCIWLNAKRIFGEGK
jgi:hypothetical protein